MPETVAVITALILERPLCISCIATKAGEPSAQSLETALERIRHVLQLDREQGRCRACGTDTIVLSVLRPGR